MTKMASPTPCSQEAGEGESVPSIDIQYTAGMLGTEQSVPAVGDDVAIEAMLGRPSRAPSTVVSRCHLGLPVVIRVPPLLDDGTPFPTLYWLVCPLAVRRLARLESAGIMAEMQTRLDVSGADAAYAGERARHLAGRADVTHAPRGGVGGAHGGIKCLHARFAYFRAGGSDPAGAEAAELIGELDCATPCVGPRTGGEERA